MPVGFRALEANRGVGFRTPAPPDWWPYGPNIVGHTLAPGSELRLWIPEGCEELVIDGARQVAIPSDAQEVWVR